MLKDMVVLVDERGKDLLNSDGQLSIVEKMEAHRRGLLHRAVSVFIFNNSGDILLQQRASNKYHSPGKWSNTCCTHPLPGETALAAAARRLHQEMGLTTMLSEAFAFRYKVTMDNGLIEHEFDHVFFGRSNQNPCPDPAEVSMWDWVPAAKLEQELVTNPEEYSLWLPFCFDQAIKHLLQTQMKGTEKLAQARVQR